MRIRWHLVVAPALLSLACDVPGTPPPPPDGSARIAGEIRDGAGQPVASASIRVPFGDRQSYQATTGADGKYSMSLPVEQFTNVSPVVMFAIKDGYRPFAAWFTRIEEGNTYTFGTNAQNPMQVLEAGEFFPPGVATLTHAGDDDFGGSENSQLQVASQGVYLPYTLTTWTSQLASATVATIFFIGRGIQTSICPGNGIGLVSARGLTEAAPLDSDPQGGFSSYALTVGVPPTDVGTPIYVFVASGTCNSNDYDDFEIGRVFVRFHF